MICLEVSGNRACFTRPEFKTERVSYDVLTPTAAVGILSSIYWHDGVVWKIKKIDVLKEIKWDRIKRNELKFIKKDNRTQRSSLILKDVAYRIYAILDFDILKLKNKTNLEKANNQQIKGLAIFTRRAKKGQCFSQPFLGCREFSADFELIEDQANLSTPINLTKDLGWMLYKLNYEKTKKITPKFFRANINNGTIIVPNEEEI